MGGHETSRIASKESSVIFKGCQSKLPFSSYCEKLKLLLHTYLTIRPKASIRDCARSSREAVDIVIPSSVLALSRSYTPEKGMFPFDHILLRKEYSLSRFPISIMALSGATHFHEADSNSPDKEFRTKSIPEPWVASMMPCKKLLSRELNIRFLEMPNSFTRNAALSSLPTVAYISAPSHFATWMAQIPIPGAVSTDIHVKKRDVTSSSTVDQDRLTLGQLPFLG